MAPSNVDLPIRFMEHILLTLSPLALKLYLHVLLCAQSRNSAFLNEDDFLLDSDNKFENQRAYKVNLRAARTELVLADLVVDDFMRGVSYIVWPDIWLKLSQFNHLWQAELSTLDAETCRALAMGGGLMVKGVNAKNLALLATWDERYTVVPTASGFGTVASARTSLRTTEPTTVSPSAPLTAIDFASAPVNSFATASIPENTSVPATVSVPTNTNVPATASVPTNMSVPATASSSPNSNGLLTSSSSASTNIPENVNVMTNAASNKAADLPLNTQLSLEQSLSATTHHDSINTTHSAATGNNNDEAAYNELVQALNQRFLAGFTSYAWVNLIDKLHFDYAFDNILIYAIFAELQSEDKLNRKYLEQYARNLQQYGIKDMQAYEKWLGQKAQFESRRPLAQRALHRNLTEAELTLINKWYDEYGYDDEIVSYAFAQSVKSSSPNLNYFDAIVSRWYKSGLRTLDEIKRSEKEFQEEVQNKKHESFVSQKVRQLADKSGAKDKFVERAYDASFFERLSANQRGMELYNESGTASSTGEELEK